MPVKPPSLMPAEYQHDESMTRAKELEILRSEHRLLIDREAQAKMKEYDPDATLEDFINYTDVSGMV